MAASARVARALVPSPRDDTIAPPMSAVIPGPSASPTALAKTHLSHRRSGPVRRLLIRDHCNLRRNRRPEQIGSCF